MSQSWKTVYVSTIMLKAISISDPNFNLDQVKAIIVISEEVTIPASQITVVKGLTTIMGHHKLWNHPLNVPLYSFQGIPLN